MNGRNCKYLVWKRKEKEALRRTKSRREDNINIDPKATEHEAVSCIQVSQQSNPWRTLKENL